MSGFEPLQLLRTLLVVLLSVHSITAMSLREEMFLTEAQQKDFDWFKAQALPNIPTKYMKEDLVLMKYFRFSSMNANKSLDLMKDNLKWRMDLGFEALSEDDLNLYKRQFPFSTFRDKFGRGVAFLPGRFWDIATATSNPELTKTFTRFFYHIIEEAYMRSVSNFTGRTASGTVVLNDLKDAGGSKTYCPSCLTVIKDISLETDKRWPGGFDIAYLLNVPTFLIPTLDLVKHALPKKMQDGIFYYDENDAVWMPELVKFIDPEKMPPELYIRSQDPNRQVEAPVAPAFTFFMPPPN